MILNVVGIQRHVEWSYNGNSGVNQRLHVEYPEPFQGPDAEGFKVEVLKVPTRVGLGDIHVGDTVDIYFNRYGAVEQVIKLNK